VPKATSDVRPLPNEKQRLRRNGDGFPLLPVLTPIGPDERNAIGTIGSNGGDVAADKHRTGPAQRCGPRRLPD
jgi:hypothetical protein